MTNSGFKSSSPLIAAIFLLCAALSLSSVAHASVFDWTDVEIAPNHNLEWRSVDSSADGSRIIVGSGRLFLSGDSGQSWTEVQPGGDRQFIWRSVASSADGRYLVAGATGNRLYTSSDFGVTWSETGPSDGSGQRSDRRWMSVDMSADGSDIVAAVEDGRVYVSSDHGEHWNETRPTGDADQRWWALAMSADGEHLVAGIFNGGIYVADVSIGGEIDWSEADPAGDGSDHVWSSAALSSNGSFLIVGDNGGRLYSHTEASGWAVVADSGEPGSPVNSDQSWWALSTSADGTRILASPDDGFPYVSIDGGDTWIESHPGGIADPNDWDASFISPDGARLVAGLWNGGLYVSDLTVGGETDWSEAQVAFYDHDWVVASADSDGSHIFAGMAFGRLYQTSDSGTTWSETGPTVGIDQEWSSVSLSADGSDVAAAVFGGGLYISSNGGEDWTPRQPGDTTDAENWDALAVSADGNVLIAGVSDGRLYVSGNGGASWEEADPVGDDSSHDWSSAAASTDGTHLVAAVRGGRIYASDDSGSTWRERADVAEWQSVAVSADGSSIVAAVFGGSIFVSRNGGEMFHEADIPGENRDWWTVDMSDDGLRSVAGADNGRLFVSIDGGDTWAEERPSGNVDQYWDAIAISGDGFRLMVGALNGKFYLGNASDQQDDGSSDQTGDVSRKARIDSWKAVLVAGDSKCVTKLRLEIKGKHFNKRAVVRIGGREASHVHRPSSGKLVATFCFDRLMNVKTDLVRKITVENPDSDPTRARKEMNLASVVSRLGSSDFDAKTMEGTKNIQKALVTLGYLGSDNVTGVYGPVTTRAVLDFQERHGLPRTGMVGPLTRAALADEYLKAV
jgi:photosystem II stability/assembly factor-like uncharacterized protein